MRREATRGEQTECSGCQLCVAKRFLEKLFVCGCILVLIFCLRAACCYLYMRHYPEEPKPPDMSFPNWEGVS